MGSRSTLEVVQAWDWAHVRTVAEDAPPIADWRSLPVRIMSMHAAQGEATAATWRATGFHSVTVMPGVKPADAKPFVNPLVFQHRPRLVHEMIGNVKQAAVFLAHVAAWKELADQGHAAGIVVEDDSQIVAPEAFAAAMDAAHDAWRDLRWGVLTFVRLNPASQFDASGRFVGGRYEGFNCYAVRPQVARQMLPSSSAIATHVDAAAGMHALHSHPGFLRALSLQSMVSVTSGRSSLLDHEFPQSEIAVWVGSIGVLVIAILAAMVFIKR